MKQRVGRFAHQFLAAARKRGDHGFDRFFAQLLGDHRQAARVKLGDPAGGRIGSAARRDGLGEATFRVGFVSPEGRPRRMPPGWRQAFAAIVTEGTA